MRAAFLALPAISLLLLSSGSRSPLAAVPAPKNAPPTDWPTFGGSPARNMVNLVDTVIPAAWSAGDEKPKNLLWKTPLGSRSYGSPVVSNGKVFVATNNERPRNDRDRKPPTKDDGDDPAGEPIDKDVLMCFDARTSRFLWQAAHSKVNLVNDRTREGIASTPTVDGSRVYYVAGGLVICADVNGFHDGRNDGVTDEEYKTMTDADVVWRFGTAKDLGVPNRRMAPCSPLVVGDRVFVTTANIVEKSDVTSPPPAAPGIVALDKRTGKLLWKSDVPGRSIRYDWCQAIKQVPWASPAYGIISGVPTLVVGGNGWVYGLNPDTGAMIWKFDTNPKTRAADPRDDGERCDIVGSPVVHRDRVYVGVAAQDPRKLEAVGHFWCIDPAGKTGDISPEVVEWRFPPRTIPNQKSGAAWHFGGFEKRPLPRDFVFGQTVSTACIVDDVLYIPELAGYVHCLDARTGRRFWRYDVRSAIYGSCMYADGKVFLGTEDGDVFAFRHDPRPMTLDEDGAWRLNPVAACAARLQFRRQFEAANLAGRVELDESVCATPVVAGGVLYLNGERTLFAASAKGE